MNHDSNQRVDASVEIEITAEMKNAGAPLITAFDPEFHSQWDVAAEIYTAMEVVRRKQAGREESSVQD
jgi:hypothetical protein